MIIHRLVFFFVALISRVTFFCCALVPGTLALDLPTLILSRSDVWFLSVSLRPLKLYQVSQKKLYLWDEASGRTLGVLLMSLGRKERFNVKTTTKTTTTTTTAIDSSRNVRTREHHTW